MLSFALGGRKPAEKKVKVPLQPADIRLSPAGGYFVPTTKTIVYVNYHPTTKGAGAGSSDHP